MLGVVQWNVGFYAIQCWELCNTMLGVGTRKPSNIKAFRMPKTSIKQELKHVFKTS